MKIRRTTLTAAATLIALSAVAACNDGDDARSAPSAAGAPATASPTVSASASATTSPSSTTEVPTPTPTPTATPTPTPTATATGAPVDATGAFDPAVALANADRTPYAATETMKTTASADGQGSVITASGRVNLNTPTREGRTETKMTITGSDEPMLWMEVVNTGSAVFMRDKSKPGGAWSPSSTTDDTRSDSIGDYVKALVDAGPAARKGMEQKNGVPAYHLGARMTAAQMKAIDPEEYQKLVDKGVSGKQIDVWIDRAGRVLAHTQSMKIPKDGTTVTTVVTVTYTDFGPRETFPAPTAAAS
ncbi:hypothetical protein [Streptomyces sp. XY431]|uniref:hypothetical protein n=1 Tax=Streptomyces sp. XY431 TaxID=1415562 RepID=UPI000A8B958E|nr:hypothetical protein [Streptomyces sp. XY431]